MTTEPMTVDRALGLIADGHAVYSVETGKQVMGAFDLAWDDKMSFKAHSEPNVFKGLMLNDPSLEGTLMVAALTLGSVICSRLGLKPEGKLGRGSQGRAYADAIRARVDELLIAERNVDGRHPIG